MVLTSSQLCTMLFTQVGDNMHACTTCAKIYKKGNGYTNLLNHLRRNHADYEQDAQDAARRQNPLNLRLVSQRTRDLYHWLEWVISDRLPFEFVERRLARQNAALSTVSEDTLSKYIKVVSEAVEGRIADELPESFGLVLNGWSSSNRHYVAIFAVFDSTGGATGITGEHTAGDYFDDLECSSRRFLLLAFSPVESEEELSAQSQFDLIADTLSRYKKPWEAVKFMVGDNCSVNQYIGRKECAIPVIGCASHRFNLAVKDFLKSEDELIVKVHVLMSKLRTIKGRAILRRVSHLSPLLRNETRWSSTYEMVERYVKLQPFIIQLGHGVLVEHGVQPLLLRCAEHERVKALHEDLAAFEAVTKELQKTMLTLSAVRRLFDQVIKLYPALKTRLTVTAPIVNFPNLEKMDLVKLQRGEPLNLAEKAACAEFRAPSRERSPGNAEESSIVKDAFKRRKVAKRSHFVDVSYIPPMSNECENFFFAAKLVLTDLRKRMAPRKLEMVMLLQYNRDLWDVNTVDKYCILGTPAVITTLMMRVSLFPDWNRWRKNRNTWDMSVLPCVLIFMNSYASLYYAYAIDNYMPLFATSVLGIGVGILLAYSFYRWTADQREVMNIFIISFAMCVVIALYAFLALCGTTGQSKTSVDTTLGLIMDACTTGMYASPMTIILHVVRTKTAKSMPFTMGAVNVLNSLCWGVYGALIHNMFLLAPNIIGVTLSLTQMTVTYIYRSKEPRDDLITFTASETQDAIDVVVITSDQDKEHGAIYTGEWCRSPNFVAMDSPRRENITS